MAKIEVQKIDDMTDYHASEAIKRLRTNLQLCGADRKVIVMTSCLPNEGKSTTSMNLCISLAETGKKVLLIDADLRKSVMAHRLHLSSSKKGLSHFLSGMDVFRDVINETNIPGLHMVLAGPTMPNPAEMLARDTFKQMLSYAKTVYDYIIIDAPPIGAVIDAAIIAPACDGIVLVIASGEINKRFAANVQQQLVKTGTPLLGVVLNKCDMQAEKYGKYYGQYYGKYGRE